MFVRWLAIAATLVACGRVGFDTTAPEGPLAIDPSFDGNGFVAFGGTAGRYDYASGVAIDAQDRIVLVGRTENLGTQLDLALWRILDDGRLDPGLATVGYIAYHASPYDWGCQLSIDDLGRIVVGGNVDYGSDDPTVFRFLDDGSPDPGFGTSGRNAIDVSGEVQGRWLIPRAAGWIAVGAQYENWSSLSAFTTDGTPDPTFGAGGLVTFSAVPMSTFNKGTVDAQGRIVMVGSAQGAGRDLLVARFLADGSLDPAFAGTGWLTLDGTLAIGADEAGTGVVTIDDDIVITGWARDPVGGDLAVWRLRPDGSLDPGFGVGGIVTHHDAAGGGGDDAGNSVIRSNGQLVVVGTSAGPGANATDVAVWRLTETGDLVDVATTDAGYGADEGMAVAIDRLGRVVVVGVATAADGDPEAAVFRFAPR